MTRVKWWNVPPFWVVSPLGAYLFGGAALSRRRAVSFYLPVSPCCNVKVGKIVKRSFGRGVVSFGKVVGWFPPEEEGDEVRDRHQQISRQVPVPQKPTRHAFLCQVLYHILHGDGDEEDLDEDEVASGVKLADLDAAKVAPKLGPKTFLRDSRARSATTTPTPLASTTSPLCAWLLSRLGRRVGPVERRRATVRAPRQQPSRWAAVVFCFKPHNPPSLALCIIARYHHKYYAIYQ